MAHREALRLIMTDPTQTEWSLRKYDWSLWKIRVVPFGSARGKRDTAEMLWWPLQCAAARPLADLRDPQPLPDRATPAQESKVIEASVIGAAEPAGEFARLPLSDSTTQVRIRVKRRP
jgi:hypothetical protein